MTLPWSKNVLKFADHHPGMTLVYDVAENKFSTFVGFDNRNDTLSLEPKSETNDYIIYVLDESGRYVKNYYLTVHYLHAADGIKSWHVDVGASQQNLNNFNVHGTKEYDAAMPLAQTSVDLHLNWTQEVAEFSLYA